MWKMRTCLQRLFAYGNHRKPVSCHNAGIKFPRLLRRGDCFGRALKYSTFAEQRPSAKAVDYDKLCSLCQNVFDADVPWTDFHDEPSGKTFHPRIFGHTWTHETCKAQQVPAATCALTN